MVLAEVGTHAVIDTVFGPESEQVLAGRLLDALRPGMLLLGDRNFPSWRLWGQAASTGAHLLWRVKAGMLLPPHRHVPGDHGVPFSAWDQQVEQGGALVLSG